MSKIFDLAMSHLPYMAYFSSHKTSKVLAHPRRTSVSECLSTISYNFSDEKKLFWINLLPRISHLYDRKQNVQVLFLSWRCIDFEIKVLWDDHKVWDLVSVRHVLFQQRWQKLYIQNVMKIGMKSRNLLETLLFRIVIISFPKKIF